MRPITAALLINAVGCSSHDAERFVDPIIQVCQTYSLENPARLGAFLAQTGHESMSFSRTTESLSYSAAGLLATWPSRFTRELAEQMARDQQAIAEHVYGGRMGNNRPGDGWKYRGRGLIQITGKVNFESITECIAEKLAAAVPDFVIHPDKLAEPYWAAMSAGCFWADKRLNELADAGDFDKITTRINGGQNGKADRRARFSRALKALAS